MSEKRLYLYFTYEGEECNFGVSEFARPMVGEEVLIEFPFNVPANRNQGDPPNFLTLTVDSIHSAMRLYDSGSTLWETVCDCTVKPPTNNAEVE